MCVRRFAPCFLAAVLGCGRADAPPPPDAAAPLPPADPPPPIASASADPSASASASAAPAAASSSPRAALPPLPAAVGSIDEVAAGAIERGEVPGAVIAVVRGGNVIFQKAYGLRSKEPDERP